MNFVCGYQFPEGLLAKISTEGAFETKNDLGVTIT